MPDDDRTLDAELVEPRTDQRRQPLEPKARTGALAMARQIERDAEDMSAEPIDDRAPRAAVEREPMKEDDRNALARALTRERDRAGSGRQC